MTTSRLRRFARLPGRWWRALCKCVIPRDVFESFRPILLIFLLLGIMPFRLEGGRGQHYLRPVVYGCLITVGYIIAFVVSFAFCVRLPEIFLGYIIPSTFTRIIDQFMITSALCAVLIMLFVCLRRKDCLVRLVNLLATVDERLEGIGGRVRHGRAMWQLCRRMAISWLVYGLYVFGSRELLWQLQEDTIIWSWVSYFMPHMMGMGFLFKWRTITHMLEHRYAVLNKVLAKLHQNTNLEHTRKAIKRRQASASAKNPKDSVGNSAANLSASQVNVDREKPSPTTIPTDAETERTIETACRIHEDLCDACYITEEYFSVVMLTIVTIGFLIIVFNAYYVLEVLFRHGGRIDAETASFIVFLVYQMFIHGLGLVCIVQNSSAVLQENEKCSIHVHKLMNRVTTEAARQRLLEFSLQLLNRNVRFTAVNLFPLDRTLIFTIVGAATTYLIILVQFSLQFR